MYLTERGDEMTLILTSAFSLHDVRMMDATQKMSARTIQNQRHQNTDPRDQRPKFASDPEAWERMGGPGEGPRGRETTDIVFIKRLLQSEHGCCPMT